MGGTRDGRQSGGRRVGGQSSQVERRLRLRCGALHDRGRTDFREQLPLHALPEADRFDLGGEHVPRGRASHRHSGETTRHIVRTGSGGEQAIIRCAACGTALWSFYPRLGELGVGVRAGTLDDPGAVRPDAVIAVRPDAVIFTASRMPWVALPEGIPHFEASYNAQELLPPERFARLAALIALRAAQREAAG